MFSPQGPSLVELTRQALSSVEHGYDLLAPTFDHTPFRTPDRLVAAVVRAVAPLGPFQDGLDLCCGTGAGVAALREVCEENVVGVDFSAGMLARAEASAAGATGRPSMAWVRADARDLPFTGAFDLAVSFGAFGHFLPSERPGLFAGVFAALRPGGRFVFPVAAPAPVGSRAYWALWGFDAAMRVRNAVWRPRFVMYYRTFRLPDVLDELADAGFAVETAALPEYGTLRSGGARCAVLVATRP